MKFVRSHIWAALVASLGLMVLSAPARAEGWGTLKGQVVWGGKGVPKAVPVNVDKDKEHCLSKGPLKSEEYVVNEKNKGVRWVMVWLVNADDTNVRTPKPLPIHPSLKEPKEKQVVIDQPCCAFEPHALFMRTGQDLVVKNSAPIAHNVMTIARKNPSINVLIPAGKETVLKDMETEVFPPVQISCSIHGWMKAKLIVLPHPYFAVTDANGNFEIKNAPAGKFRLILWQEGKGWVQGGNKGIPVEIKANETTDLKKIELTPDPETAASKQ
jgi:hypothetical protein